MPKKHDYEDFIKPSASQKRVPRTFRIRMDIDKELDRIVEKTGETKSYVIDQLLELALKTIRERTDK